MLLSGKKLLTPKRDKTKLGFQHKNQYWYRQSIIDITEPSSRGFQD